LILDEVEFLLGGLFFVGDFVNLLNLAFLSLFLSPSPSRSKSDQSSLESVCNGFLTDFDVLLFALFDATGASSSSSNP
jgi:hypothetical protein